MKEIPGIIDVHHHMVPREYVEALKNIGVTTSLGRNLPPWDAAEIVEFMDQNGIATSYVSVTTPGVYFPHAKDPLDIAIRLSRQMNDYCAGVVRDYPGRFGAFATLPLPDIDAALVELRYALDELNFNGVTLLSNYDGYYLGDPRFDRLLAELNRRKTVVFVHPTPPPGLELSHFGFPELMVEAPFDTTRTACSLVLRGQTEKYPDIRFILAHAGGTLPYLVERVRGTAVFLQLGEAIPKGFGHYMKQFYYDLASSATPCALSSLTRSVDTSHILFGSDHVFVSEAGTAWNINGLRGYGEFTADDIAAIEYRNARELFAGKRGMP